MRKRGEFPEPLEISAGCNRWSEKSYTAYLARLEAGDATHDPVALA
jgi:hypothetical protein